VTNPDVLSIFGLIFFYILNLTTHAAHSALNATSLVRLHLQREEGIPQIQKTAELLGEITRLQASLSLVQVVLRFLIAGLALWIFVPWVSQSEQFLPALVTLFLGGLLVYFGEWSAEVAVTREPETWAVRLTPFARSLMILSTPLIGPLITLARKSGQELESSVTENELISLVEAGQQEGVLEQEEQKMIVSIFRLGDTLAREIMVPRIDILALDVNTPIDESIDALLKSGHSRVPVFKDTVDNVLGLLYAKDLLRVWREGNHLESLSTLLRPAYFVPETKKADELLAELQAKRIHMAIVVDEYGGVAGLVTLEDIVEEIVGEIQDEYDQSEEMLFQAIDDKEYLFQGRIDLDDFNEIMGTELSNTEADTLSGLIYSRIGRVPTVGDSVEIDDLKLIVEQISGQRIRKVRALRLLENSEQIEKEKNADG
jgi:CBS domain containing-hemolysin-like protein